MLDNAAGFRENILRNIDTRDVLVNKLDNSMPELKPINTKSLLQQNRGLSNDFLFRSIYQSIVDHNEDVSKFQATAPSDQRKNADELMRLSLKQKHLNAVAGCLAYIKEVAE